MIINLIRSAVPHAQMGEEACHAEAPGVPAHRVAASPFEAAEREVRRRVLRSLADRANPPTALVFVRTWEQLDLGEETGELAVPVQVTVSAEQVQSGPRRGRARKAAP